MHGFYHVRKANGLAIPHILGLTASPGKIANTPRDLSALLSKLPL